MPWETLIASIVSVIAGGGGVAAWFKYRTESRRIGLDEKQQDVEVGLLLRDELRKKVEDLENRVGHLEEELSRERNLRAVAELERARAEVTIERYKAEVIRLRNDAGISTDDIESELG